MLRAVWAGGVRHFDCASLSEVALVRKLLPAAEIHFMHPVKSRHAIRDAFNTHGVTDFAVDSTDELAKILQETVPVGLVGDPLVLGLFVRLALPKGGAVYDLSGKFGAPLDEAIELLHAARPHAARLGIAFHVGSQCLEPEAYSRAIRLAREAITRCGVPVDIVDVGGGFPVSYPDMTPPPLADSSPRSRPAPRDYPGLSGYGRSPDGRSSPAADLSSRKCSCAEEMFFSSTMASTAI